MTPNPGRRDPVPTGRGPSTDGYGACQSSPLWWGLYPPGADNIDPLAKFSCTPGNQQQRHVIAIKIHIRQLLGRAKTVIADHDKQCLVVIRQLFCPAGRTHPAPSSE